MKQCHFCKRDIRDDAVVCRYCNASLGEKSIEKRRSPRYKFLGPIEYKRLDDSSAGFQYNAQCKNISMGGMLFTTDQKLPVSTAILIKLQMFIGEPESNALLLRSEVVGCKETSGGYDIKAVFVDPDMITKARLKELIRCLE